MATGLTVIGALAYALPLSAGESSGLAASVAAAVGTVSLLGPAIGPRRGWVDGMKALVRWVRLGQLERVAQRIAEVASLRTQLRAQHVCEAEAWGEVAAHITVDYRRANRAGRPAGVSAPAFFSNAPEIPKITDRFCPLNYGAAS